MEVSGLRGCRIFRKIVANYVLFKGDVYFLQRLVFYRVQLALILGIVLIAVPGNNCHFVLFHFQKFHYFHFNVKHI
jgi:hypothetical protein